MSNSAGNEILPKNQRDIRCLIPVIIQHDWLSCQHTALLLRYFLMVPGSEGANLMVLESFWHYVAVLKKKIIDKSIFSR